MNQPFRAQVLVVIVRVVLATVFVYAGIAKIASPRDFANSIAAFRVVTISLVNLTALGLPFFEISIGLMLLFGWKVRAASLGAMMLFAVFVALFVQALIRGINVDCGCFGSNTPIFSNVWLPLVRNVLLFGVSAWLYFKEFADHG
jgi:uncharacterized membrane protein YphA (DoxX/SURF4 family)